MTTNNREIIIIGGGIIGASLAYWLASNGQASKIILVEGNPTVAYRGTASFASAGLISATAHPDMPPALLTLIRRSLGLYPQLIARLKEEQPAELISYTELGELRLAADQEQAAELEQRQRWYVQSGLDSQARWLSAQEVSEIEPLAGPNFGAVYHPAAIVRAAWLTQALVKAAQTRGVEVQLGQPVTALLTEKQRVTGIKLKNGDEYKAEKVVVAAGAWSGVWLDEQLEKLGLTTASKVATAQRHYARLIWPVRGQMLSLQPVSGMPTLQHLVVGSDGYAFPRGDGTLAYGATEEPQAGFEAQLTPAGLDELRLLVQNLTPSLAKATIAERWVGLRPGSRFGRPLIGPVSQLEGLWLVGGHFRSGILLAPATAELLGQALLNPTSPDTATLASFAIPTEIIQI